MKHHTVKEQVRILQYKLKNLQEILVALLEIRFGTLQHLRKLEGELGIKIFFIGLVKCEKVGAQAKLRGNRCRFLRVG